MLIFRFHEILERLAGEQVRVLEGRLGEEVRRIEDRLTQRTSRLEQLANQTKADLQLQVNKVGELDKKIVSREIWQTTKQTPNLIFSM